MIGVIKGAIQSQVDPNLKLELKFNTNVYTDLAGTVGAGQNDYVRAWRSTVGGHFTQATDAARPQRQSDGLYFDGGDFVVAGANSQSLGTSHFFIEAWVNTTGATHKGIIGQRLDAANYWTFEINNIALQFFGAVGGVDCVNYLSGNVLTLGAWQHVAASYGAGGFKFFVGGAEVTKTTYTAIGNVGTYSTPWRVGYTSWAADFFTGKLTDIRIYDTAKYTANFTPPTRSS